MKIEDFENLRQHLNIIQPAIKDFCNLYGYRVVNPASIGRYPRIRVEKEGEINRWIDLWMELNEKGRRYESFFEDIPYELSAGANIMIDDGSKYGCRYQNSIVIFSGKPFKKIISTLLSDLKIADAQILSWTYDDLKTNGKKIMLG